MRSQDYIYDTETHLALCPRINFSNLALSDQQHLEFSCQQISDTGVSINRYEIEQNLFFVPLSQRKLSPCLPRSILATSHNKTSYHDLESSLVLNWFWFDIDRLDI